jgi:CheY-like chemotaxis protein
MGAKVLVVEDDPFLLKAYHSKLVNSGFDVQMATDGVEALKLLESFIPAVIILDLVMPRKDGFATLQAIKATPTLKDIPVIVATNTGQPDDVARVKELGAADCITKSNLSMEDLVKKVNAFAEQSH